MKEMVNLTFERAKRREFDRESHRIRLISIVFDLSIIADGTALVQQLLGHRAARGSEAELCTGRRRPASAQGFIEMNSFDLLEEISQDFLLNYVIYV